MRDNIPSADVIVIGAGPNGLAAAIVAAQAGCTVTVVEAAETVGGGARTAELTLPGFAHDVCSAVHPLAVSSPFFRTLPLEKHGLEWVHPAAPLAHPLDDGSAVMLERSLDATAAALGADAESYAGLLRPMVEHWEILCSELLGPLRMPRHPLAMARFGIHGMRSARGLALTRFRTEHLRALLAGVAGHSLLPLDKLPSAAVGLVLGAAGHAVGWPFPRGGAQKLADALASYLRSLGGQIVTGVRVDSLSQLPPAPAVLCDITPRQLLRIAGDRLPWLYRRTLKHYRYGVGVFKVDWALDGPIPWRAAECARAGTVHLGGTFAEIEASEAAAFHGTAGSATPHTKAPFVLLAQPTLFDHSRAPAGAHIAWGYCHVPHASRADMQEAIESQVERFAPGFRKRIVARSVMSPAAMEQHNANLVGGDINGGVPDIFQLFARPGVRLYATPLRGLYLCSASTPPGGGVHGMCGYFAAKLALTRLG